MNRHHATYFCHHYQMVKKIETAIRMNYKSSLMDKNHILCDRGKAINRRVPITNSYNSSLTICYFRYIVWPKSNLFRYAGINFSWKCWNIVLFHTMLCSLNCYSKQIITTGFKCDWMCKKGSIHAIINIQKYNFEIYLKNDWSYLHMVFHKSIAI